MKAARIILNCATRNYSRSIVERRLTSLRHVYTTDTRNVAFVNSAYTHQFNRFISQSTDSGKNDFTEDSLENIFGELDEFSEEESAYPKEFGYNGRQELGIDLEDLKFDVDELEDFDSNFYSSNVEHTDSLQNKIDEFYEVNDIKTTGKNIPHPMFTFEETGFPDAVLGKLKKQFDKPTPIQSLSWPIALSGRDLIGIAQTGSGKTLSFLAPAIKHIMGQKKDYSRRRSPTVIVLCPTRELASQCYDMALTVCPPSVKCACVYGGSDKNRQINILSRGCNLLIATPGRLMDLIQSRYVDISGCSYAVLDEADRMLDMGFEPQIRSIFGQIRPDRQITMWSATWPHEIRLLADKYLTSKHGKVMAKIGGDFLAVNADIEQKFHFCHSRDKFECFVDILTSVLDTEFSKVLVFCNTKRTCDDLVRELSYKHSIRSYSLHGNHSQSQRENAINSFKKGSSRLLIATEVASRGLDVDNITHVINYDCAMNCTTHIHRVGRTGRAGKKGIAHTIVTEMAQVDMLKDLIQSLRDVKQPVDPKLFEVSQLLRKNKRIQKTSSNFDFNQQQHKYGNRNMENNKFESNLFQGERTKQSMSIESHQVGIVIGKGGAKIKELKEMTSTNIWIPKNDRFGESPKTVELWISGTQENINYAKHTIEDLLARINFRDQRNKEPMQKNYEEDLFDEESADIFSDLDKEPRFAR